MLPTSALVATALALIDFSAARPAQNAGTISLAAVAKSAWTVDQQMMAAYECRGQSCMIADTAGSTGRDPIMKPEGADDKDIQCVVDHNPVVGKLLKDYNNQVPDVPKQNTTWMSSTLIGLNQLLKPFSKPRESGKFTGNCTTNILIFAKGTLEPGIMGITIGPQLTSGLPKDWSAVGIDYDPDIAGDFCLGLPGGMVAKDYINGANEKCPSSNLFVSGYSQGAMVIRNGLARATDAAKMKVKGVITFGDPFNGAPIKGYNGPVEIYCAPGDGVCTGNFELTTSHLAYIFDSTVATAKKKLLDMASGKGDDNCCHPPPPPKLPSPQAWAQSIAANGGKVPTAKPGTPIEDWADALGKSNGKVPKYSVGTKIVLPLF